MKVVQQKDDARLNLMKKEGLCMRKLAHKNVIDFMVSLHTAFFLSGTTLLTSPNTQFSFKPELSKITARSVKI